jgi:hypothetical protein
MNKLISLLLCALCGALFAIVPTVISSFAEYDNLVNQALENNIKTETFHIVNITTVTEDNNKKYLNTVEGIQLIVTKSDGPFWEYRAGDEISVTYGRVDSDNKSLYNYKTTNLLSSGNEYKPIEQKQTLTWKIRQAKIEE